MSKWEDQKKTATNEPQIDVRRFPARELFRQLLPLIRPYTGQLALAAVLVSMVGLAIGVMPLFTKYIIDVAIPRRDVWLAAKAMSLFVAVMFLRMTLWYIAQLRVMWVKEKLLYALRTKSFQHLQQLCLRFHNRYASGFLYERVFGQSINQMGGFLQMVFNQFTVCIITLVFSLAFCLYLNAPMTAIVFIGAIGYVAAGKVMSPRIHSKWEDFINAANAIAQYIVDKLRGTKTIQAMTMEDRVQAEFEGRIWPMQLRAMDAQLETLKLGFATEGVGYIITAVILVGGAYAVLDWHMEIGTLVAFIGYEATLIGMVQQLVNVYGQFMSVRAGFDQLFTVLNTPSTVVEKPGAVLHKPVRGVLEFRHVGFAYDRKKVLDDVSFSVAPGEVVALVGRSGGGKTTIANLLMRFYDPDSGAVSLDGHDLRDLPLRPYRALFGVVMQDPFLFDDSIEGNLRCAGPDVSEEHLWQALEKAQAADFVREFPAGIKHRVGEAGGQLSGGQRQRIAIARCMLMNPRFLILDEATSALDSETELDVARALDVLFEGRTAFIIAHRLSTIRRADRILVIENGRIAEDGTFDQLMAKGGVFHRLHNIAMSAGDHDARLGKAAFT